MLTIQDEVNYAVSEMEDGVIGVTTFTRMTGCNGLLWAVMDCTVLGRPGLYWALLDSQSHRLSENVWFF